jgi:hypothetical protein
MKEFKTIIIQRAAKEKPLRHGHGFVIEVDGREIESRQGMGR